MAHLNSPFVQQVFHVSKRQWEPNVQHNCQTNDLWTCLEVLEWRLVTFWLEAAKAPQPASNNAVLAVLSVMRFHTKASSCSDIRVDDLVDNDYDTGITLNPVS